MKTAFDIITEAIENKTAGILTIGVAKSLKGKKIITKYHGYRGQDGVEEFVVGDIKSAWQLAEENTDPCFAPHANQAAYWASYQSEVTIATNKAKLFLLTAEGENLYIFCESQFNNIFCCTDSDRYVYFVMADEPAKN